MAAPTKSREKTRVQALSQLRGVAEEVYMTDLAVEFLADCKANFFQVSMCLFIIVAFSCLRPSRC